MYRLLPAVAVLLTAHLSAADGDALRHNVGIGLGTLIFDGHDGLLSQVCAATTNTSTCFNQTWMISFGLGGATPFTGLASNEKVKLFVHDNLDQLAREMAAGGGESLDTLADLAGVPDPARPAFTRALHDHFAQIFDSPMVTDAQVIAHMAAIAPSA